MFLKTACTCGKGYLCQTAIAKAASGHPTSLLGDICERASSLIRRIRDIHNPFEPVQDAGSVDLAAKKVYILWHRQGETSITDQFVLAAFLPE
jgi:hypothetical protein